MKAALLAIYSQLANNFGCCSAVQRMIAFGLLGSITFPRRHSCPCGSWGKNLADEASALLRLRLRRGA